MTRPNTIAELFTKAAAALVRRDGDSFERLIATNEDWLQRSDEREANRKALLAMQEAAYLLDGEPSEFSEEFGDRSDDEEWSGSPDPEDPDNFWICDKTGRRIPA